MVGPSSRSRFLDSRRRLSPRARFRKLPRYLLAFIFSQVLFSFTLSETRASAAFLHPTRHHVVPRRLPLHQQQNLGLAFRFLTLVTARLSLFFSTFKFNRLRLHSFHLHFIGLLNGSFPFLNQR
jgi:hypothetical protein